MKRHVAQSDRKDMAGDQAVKPLKHFTPIPSFRTSPDFHQLTCHDECTNRRVRAGVGTKQKLQIKSTDQSDGVRLVRQPARHTMRSWMSCKIRTIRHSE